MIASPSPASTSLALGIAEFIAEKKTMGNTKVHVRTMHGRLKQFALAFGGNTPVAAVDRQRLLTYISKRGSPRTQVNHLKSIKPFLAWARDVKRWLPANELTVAHNLTIKAPQADPEFYTPAQMRQLLVAACQKPKGWECFVALLVLGGFCGIRPQEILRIRHVNILHTHGVVKMDTLVTKTSRRRMVPIPPNAAAWLEIVLPQNGSGLIIPDKWHSNIGRFTGEIADAAGVLWIKNGLRHSFGTYAMARENNDARVAEWMGNSPKILQAFYKGLALPADADEWFEITPDNTL